MAENCLTDVLKVNGTEKKISPKFRFTLAFMRDISAILLSSKSNNDTQRK